MLWLGPAGPEPLHKFALVRFWPVSDLPSMDDFRSIADIEDVSWYGGEYAKTLAGACSDRSPARFRTHFGIRTVPDEAHPVHRALGSRKRSRRDEPHYRNGAQRTAQAADCDRQPPWGGRDRRHGVNCESCPGWLHRWSRQHRTDY